MFCFFFLVAPVSVAVLTPFPLLFLFLVKKAQSRFCHSHSKLSQEEILKTDKNSNNNGVGIHNELQSIAKKISDVE